MAVPDFPLVDHRSFGEVLLCAAQEVVEDRDLEQRSKGFVYGYLSKTEAYSEPHKHKTHQDDYPTPLQECPEDLPHR